MLLGEVILRLFGTFNWMGGNLRSALYPHEHHGTAEMALRALVIWACRPLWAFGVSSAVFGFFWLIFHRNEEFTVI